MSGLWILRRGPTVARLRILIYDRLRKIIPVWNFRARSSSSIQRCGGIFCKLRTIHDKSLAVLGKSFGGGAMPGQSSRWLNPEGVNLNATDGRDVLRRNSIVDDGVVFEIEIVDDC